VITSEPAYKQTLKLLIGVCESLAAVPTAYPTANQQWRAILSDGLIDQARDLLQEIDDDLHEGLGDGGWAPGPDADTVECEGVLRAIDLDRLTMTVRVGEDMRDAVAASTRTCATPSRLPSIDASDSSPAERFTRVQMEVLEDRCCHHPVEEKPRRFERLAAGASDQSSGRSTRISTAPAPSPSNSVTSPASSAADTNRRMNASPVAAASTSSTCGVASSSGRGRHSTHFDRPRVTATLSRFSP
jgi:hypothetical protein